MNRGRLALCHPNPKANPRDISEGFAREFLDYGSQFRYDDDNDQYVDEEDGDEGEGDGDEMVEGEENEDNEDSDEENR